MPIFETFAKRMKKQREAGKPVLFQYDRLPDDFRVQVIHIWMSTIGIYGQTSFGMESSANAFWKVIFDTMARELGTFRLVDVGGDPFQQCQKYLRSADVENALSIIELSFRLIDGQLRRVGYEYPHEEGVTQNPDSAIAELNHRFREHAIGYQYIGGAIVRSDSEYLHSEVVAEAVDLLHSAKFKGASEEFMRAHEHYRKGRNKEAIAEALKAFESTMKTIILEQGWDMPPTPTAKPLLDKLIEKGLIPADLASHFAGLRSAMESGLPTLSNRTSRHGQGAVPTVVPDYYVAFSLHLAASNIVFLVEAHQAARERR
jgi:AbiJ N-terminal domain 4